MARDRQQAAQMRASQIRTLKMIWYRLRLIDNEGDRRTVEYIIDRQLASMGAETMAEERERNHLFHTQSGHTDKEYDDLMKPWGGKKQYKITNEDVRRYNNW